MNAATSKKLFLCTFIIEKNRLSQTIHQEIHAEHSRAEKPLLVCIEYLLQDHCSLIGRAVSAGSSVRLRFVPRILKDVISLCGVRKVLCVVIIGLWASAFSTYKSKYLLENGKVQKKRTFFVARLFPARCSLSYCLWTLWSIFTNGLKMAGKQK